MRGLPSPSFFMSLLAILIALGGAGYSATDGNFILGRSNSASTQTRLVTPLAGTAFRVDNTNTAAGSTALGLFVGAGRTPFTVNSTVKVANLNADLLDGLNSTGFTRKRVVAFNLAQSQTSAPIPFPVEGPVYVVGAVLGDTNNRGAGHGIVMRVPDNSITDGFLLWNGLHSCCRNPLVSNFGTAAPGTEIFAIDGLGEVALQVNDATTIRVRNNGTLTRSGTVTLMW